MKTFPSRGFLLSPISVTALPIQIVQLIRAVPTFFRWNRIGLIFQKSGLLQTKCICSTQPVFYLCDSLDGDHCGFR